MSDYIASIIRTWVPVVVGLAAGWLAREWGFVIDEDSQAQAVAMFSAAATGLWYALVRFVEQKFPQVGWLLGLAKAPTYTAAHLEP